MRKTVTLLLLVVLFASCCACRTKKKDLKPLLGTTWSMIQIDGMAFDAEDNYYFIINEEGEFNGVGDCNSFMGSYEMDKKGSMIFNSIASTRAMCPNQSAEDNFLKMFSSVDSYSRDGRLLMLLSGDDIVAIFEQE